MREEMDFCAPPAAPGDSLRLRSGSQEATDWVAADEDTLRFRVSVAVRHAKQMMFSRRRLRLSHHPNPQMCKHADIFLRVFLQLGSEISFVTFREIKIPIFSLIQDRCVPTSLIHHESYQHCWSDGQRTSVCSEAISPQLKKKTTH